MSKKTVASLKAAPYNPRKITDAQLATLGRTLAEFGDLSGIVVNNTTGHLIGGHMRLRHLDKKWPIMAEKVKDKTGGVAVGQIVTPWGPLAYREVEWPEQKEKAANIAANKVGGDFDIPLLKDLLVELDDGGFDITLTGFDERELKKLIDWTPEGGITDQDEVPELPKNPLTKSGDLYILGNHRLLCGDSTNKNDVEKLIDIEKADICFTSPPYGLGKSMSLRGNKKLGKNAYDKHDDNPKEWLSLMDGWFSASENKCHAWLVNVQPLSGNKRGLWGWINDRVDRLSDIITWDKGHAAPVIAAGVLSSRFEWIIVLSVPGSSRAIPFSSWRGIMQNVYQAPMQRQNDFAGIHGATMPVHLPCWIMGDLCDKSKSVYDPFCGTGTTMIAAEKLNRSCYGMEISQAYCDVIVERWQNFTGKKAVKK